MWCWPGRFGGRLVGHRHRAAHLSDAHHRRCRRRHDRRLLDGRRHWRKREHGRVVERRERAGDHGRAWQPRSPHAAATNEDSGGRGKRRSWLAQFANLVSNGTKFSLGQATFDAAAHFVLADDTTPTTVSAWDGRHAVFGRSGTTGGATAFSFGNAANTAYLTFAEPGVAWSHARFDGDDFAFYSLAATLGFHQDSSGNVYDGLLTSNGLLKTTGGTGEHAIATAGIDYQLRPHRLHGLRLSLVRERDDGPRGIERHADGHRLRKHGGDARRHRGHGDCRARHARRGEAGLLRRQLVVELGMQRRTGERQARRSNDDGDSEPVFYRRLGLRAVQPRAAVL